LGRIVIRAMSAYFKAGGKSGDIEKLKMSALGMGLGLFLGLDLDPLGYLSETASTTGEAIDITAELLTEAIELAHPDKHPPERHEAAHRVTQQLVALKPFVFPKPKPKPEPPRSASHAALITRSPTPTPSMQYPCKECRSSIPYYYCDSCKTEWRKRRKVERERQAKKQREWYARRKKTKALYAKPRHCPCGAKINSKRSDARFCSDRCRQVAHRNCVTAQSRASDEILTSCDAELAGGAR
jgi:hypothetical protein